MSDIIIFGCSPYINNIKEYIPELQLKYDTAGINMFPVFFPNVKHWFFFDDNMLPTAKKHYKNQVIHTRLGLEKKIIESNIVNYELFNVKNELENANIKLLFFHNFTITLTLSWCICKGFKNVYLAGIDMDSTNWLHFYGLKKEFFVPQNRLNEAVNLIYKMQKYINIFQLNPCNNLNLPKKDIKELLNVSK